MEVAAPVNAIESDIAVLLGVNIPQDPAGRLSAGLAAARVGRRLPVEGVASRREPVRATPVLLVGGRRRDTAPPHHRFHAR